jgi:phosphatidate cytidylyltransferase
MGTVLIALAIGVLVIDQKLAPFYPFLLILVLGLAIASCHELLGLLGPERQLPAWLCYTSVAGLLAASWIVQGVNPWPWLGSILAIVILVAFLREMAVFQEPGGVVMRLALVFWIVGYLGLLPSFLVQLRWLPDPDSVQRGTLALAMTIFVPKMGDTGAYFTGRLFGKHKMAPVLSPKKTWEGATGGMVASVLTAIGINRLGPALAGGLLVEIGFGLSVGIAGLLGDLAESLIKRDCQQKDASQIMPGFGGVLDVVDALLFAAPVAYWWFQQ